MTRFNPDYGGTFHDGPAGGTPLPASVFTNIEGEEVALDLLRMLPVATATASGTAIVGTLVPCDATAGAFTVTLPSAPQDGAQVAVKKIDSTSNAVTVTCGGTDTFIIGGTSLVLAVQGHAATFRYTALSGQWTTVSNDLPLVQADARYSKARLGPRWLFYGDSIVAGAVTADQTFWNGSFVVQMALLSGGQIRHTYNAGQPGQNTAWLLANFDTIVTPHTAGLDCILFNTGAHDAGITTFSTWTGSYIGVINKIIALGKTPILTTMFPQTGATTTVQKGITQTNSFIRRFAAKNGFLLLDVYRAATDPTNGGWKSGYSSDNIHPLPAAQTAVGQACATQIAPLMPPADYVTSQWNNDPNNLLTNAMFSTWTTAKLAPTIAAGTTVTTGGSLAAGTYYYVVTYLDFNGSTTASNEISVTITAGQQPVINITNNNGPGARQYRIFRSTTSGTETFLAATSALSFTDPGTATPTSEPPAAVNGTSFPTNWNAGNAGPLRPSQQSDSTVAGSVLRLTDYNGRNTNDALVQTVSTGWSVGDTLAITAKMRTAGGTSPSIKVICTGGTPNGTPAAITADGTTAWGFGVYYQEFVVPSGTTSITVYLQEGGGTLTIDYGEVALMNLTAMGVL